ncbi:MAG TPA: hypothetical protein VK559_04730 [Ferruginibacter sp.]|nr:hypothetical protein [Ferruginibacter sp.]
MKPVRTLIQIAKHTLTGAKVPVVIDKVDDNNVILAHRELTKGRKAFNLTMLENRWDKCRDDVIELLKKYEIPGHLRSDCPFEDHDSVLESAIFFEEYIYGLEKKEKIYHNKLKARKFLMKLDN